MLAHPVSIPAADTLKADTGVFHSTITYDLSTSSFNLAVDQSHAATQEAYASSNMVIYFTPDSDVD